MKTIIKTFIKTILMITIIASTISITTNVFAYSIIGQWNTRINGIFLKWVIKDNGTCTYFFKGTDGSPQSIESTWQTRDGNIYETNSNGQVAYGSISMPDKNHIVVTVIDNGYPQQVGQVRIYTRANLFVSFKGQQHCRGNHNSCPCPGYEKKSRADWHCKYCWCLKNWHIDPK